jgi:hypothetical protein
LDHDFWVEFWDIANTVFSSGNVFNYVQIKGKTWFIKADRGKINAIGTI